MAITTGWVTIEIKFLANFLDFRWQEKLVALLIANLIGYLQCENRVTKVKERRQLQAT